MNGKHVFDAMPQTLVHGAEGSASKIAEAVETASARVAKGAGQVAKSAGQASGMASELTGQIKGKVAQAPLEVKDAKLSMRDAKLSLREKRLNVMQKLIRSTVRRQAKMLPSGTDAMVKAQLVKTSRELAHESSDLNAAVNSLNKIIRANRRAAAKSRTRLLGGAAIGAALMYHLDSEHGRERRAATAQMLTRMVRGERQPPVAP
jgi:hypothetical protein